MPFEQLMLTIGIASIVLGVLTFVIGGAWHDRKFIIEGLFSIYEECKEVYRHDKIFFGAVVLTTSGVFMIALGLILH